MSRSVEVRRSWRLLLPPYALIVPIGAGLAGAAFLAWRPGVARSMLASPRALGFSLVVGALVLGLGWLLPRLGRGPLVTACAQLVPVLLAFAATVLPAFHDVTVDEPPPVAAAATADVVGRAPLRGVDHRASGTALLVALADGSHVVRLASLDVEPCPDYQLHLVPGAGREEPDTGVHLGRLRGNKGNLTYDVPPEALTQQPLTVLIWCRAFAVPVAAATIG
jgi:Electron transfer DM13